MNGNDNGNGNKNDIIICPHCNDFIIIEKLNCGIFRHGIMKNTIIQIDPHLDKNSCDKLLSENLIYGCGKPFQIIQNNNVYEVKICDYI
jgi:hypothetical protein